MPWVSGFLGRKGVLDALLRGYAAELSRILWLVVIPAPVTCAYTCNCSLESGLLG